MSIIEQFLNENPDIVSKPYDLPKAYSNFLQKQYAKCPSEEGKKLLQEEADRFSEIWCKYVRELLGD